MLGKKRKIVNTKTLNLSGSQYIFLHFMFIISLKVHIICAKYLCNVILYANLISMAAPQNLTF